MTLRSSSRSAAPGPGSSSAKRSTPFVALIGTGPNRPRVETAVACIWPSDHELTHCTGTTTVALLQEAAPLSFFAPTARAAATQKSVGRLEPIGRRPAG